MSVITTADFKKGIFILFKNEPHSIVEYQHVNPGKGSAFVRTRVKSLKTGKVQEFTYKSGESVEELAVETHEMQYLYPEGEGYVFMDNQTYDQVTVPEFFIGDFSRFLRANDIYQILLLEGEAVGIRLPKKVRLKVVEAADGGAKGNTIGGAQKAVTLETGAVVNVPLFIKEGETIAIDPETGEYVERA
jgi:elongation factor P